VVGASRSPVVSHVGGKLRELGLVDEFSTLPSSKNFKLCRRRATLFVTFLDFLGIAFRDFLGRCRCPLPDFIISSPL
jgi:hypothetical protein